MTTSTSPGPVVYGVDFGMSTSCLAVLDADGRTRLVTDPALRVGSQHAVPTAVCLDDSGAGLLVGGEAVNAKYARPEAYRDNFKLDITVDSRPIALADRSFEVVEVVTAVLRFLRDRARAMDPRDPAATVLTVPVEWAAGRRQLLTEAAVAAGFGASPLYLIEEPIAAIEYARSVHMAADQETVLVYDLGGGTFDCALAMPTDNGKRTIRLKDFLPIGGRSFDYKILHLLALRFPEQVGAVLEAGGPGAEPWRRLRLLETCESLKLRLSEGERAREPLTELGPGVDVEITRAEFENLVRSDIAETIRRCQKMLSELGLTWDQVDAIVPVGGSSRIPLVQQELEALAPGHVRITAALDTAVARGAALLAREQASRAARESRANPQTLAPPALWVPRAALPDPPTIGARSVIEFSHGWVPWIWATILPGLLVAVDLSVAHWRWHGFWAAFLAGLVLLAAGAAGWLSVPSDKNPHAAELAAVASMLAGLILVVTGGQLGYRSLGGHHGASGSLGWWALGTGLLALVSAAIQIGARYAAGDTRASRAHEAGDSQLAQRVSEQRWFGQADASPDFMAPLFAIPALRGFELATARGSTGFAYALAAGSRILLISMPASVDERPELDAAAANWTSRLARANATFKTILVVPGHQVPTLRFDEQFAMTSMMTTYLTFVDTVGHWLDQDNRIVLPAISSLLGDTALS